MLPITISQLIIRQYQASDITEQADAVTESVETVGQWPPWCTKTYSIAELLSGSLSVKNASNFLDHLI